MKNRLPRWFSVCLVTLALWLLVMPPLWMLNMARRADIPISAMWLVYRPDFLLGLLVAGLVPAALRGWRWAGAGLVLAAVTYAVAAFSWGTAVGLAEVHMYAVALLGLCTAWFQRASNKPLQPTPAAELNGQPETAGSGRRG